MSDFLDVLAHDAQETIDSGYYEAFRPTASHQVSFKKTISDCQVNPVITEIKAASPSAGTIRKEVDATGIAKAMEKAGAVGLSVLTEPKHFNGSLNSLVQAREAVKIPILMKDIFLSHKQLQTASQIGANAVLFIQALFQRGYTESSLEDMIAKAHSRGLEVLLEIHNKSEGLLTLKTDADMVGINNRDLRTLKVDLNTTKEIIDQYNLKEKVIISESGINTKADLLFLRKCGAKAFLIGSAIMSNENIEERVKEFVLANEA